MLSQETSPAPGARPPGRILPRPLEAVFLAGGLALALAYFWLMDDAFIFFRYVDNCLFLDIGLVYNAGEYVEGFSSPLWVLILLPLRALEISYPAIVIGIGVASFLAFGWMVVAVNRELSPRDAPIANVPLSYLGFCYGVSCYFTSGMETPLVQLGAAACALYIVRPSSRWLGVVVGLLPMVRHDLLPPVLICAAWSWLRGRRAPWHLLATAGGSLLGWGIFRIWYYADLLPNTYYLKTGTHLAQGWVYLNDTFRTYATWPLAGLFLLLGLALRRRGVRLRGAERGVMLLAALVVVAFVLKIGGDARHYRYLAFPFVLAVCACGGLVEHSFSLFRASRARILAPTTGIAVALLALSFYPPQLDRHPLEKGVRYETVGRINDAAAHRDDPELRYESWSRRANPANMRAFRRAHPRFIYLATLAKGWCVEIYQRFDQRVIHLYGLTDPLLARTRMDWERPAHKRGLVPLSRDLVNIQRGRRRLKPNLYRNLVDHGAAPDWIARNIDAIDVIAHKCYNRHAFGENLRLAFTFPPRIEP